MSNDISLRYLLFGEDRSASKAVKGVAGEAHNAATSVGGAFSKLGSSIGGEFGEILNKVGEGLSELGEHSKKMSAGLMVGGAAITGIGAALQMAGSKDKQATDQLKQAIENAGGSYADFREEIEKTIKKQENYGRSAVDSQRAMQILTQATNDPKKAIEDMGVVANVAAAKHQSLADTALQLAKVYGGGGRILKEFGITMDSTKSAATALSSAEQKQVLAHEANAKAVKKLNDLHFLLAGKTKLTAAEQLRLRNATDLVTSTHERLTKATTVLAGAQQRNKDATHASQDAIEELGKKTAGQAQASVDNFAGHIDVLKTKLGDWVAMMGQKVGPALTVLGPLLMVTGSLMQVMAARNAAAAVAQDAEAVATDRQTISQTAASIASKGWAAAQWLLNAALSANPIGLVIIAVAALVAIFIVAWKHSETFRDVVRGALHDVLEVFQAVWGWIKDNWPLLLGILTGPFGLAVVEIVKHWGDVEGFFKAAPGRIAGFFTSIGENIKTAFREAIDFVIGIWNRFVGYLKIPGFDTHIPGVPTFHGLDIGKDLKIPLLAAGGIVRSPTLAMIGERGAEAVIPLSRGGDAGGIGGTTNIFHIDGALDPDAVARKIDQLLRRLNSSTGGAVAGYAH